MIVADRLVPHGIGEYSRINRLAARPPCANPHRGPAVPVEGAFPAHSRLCVPQSVRNTVGDRPAGAGDSDAQGARQWSVRAARPTHGEYRQQRHPVRDHGAGVDDRQRDACTEAPRGRSRRRVRRPISAVAVAEVHEMRGNGFRKAAPRDVFETTCPAPSLTV